jgi:tRNA(His) 5'-end guanylyltransferase
MDKSALAERMKGYEMAEAGRKLMPLLPVCVRIDGKNFSKFTKGLERPYDERLSRLMVATTTALVKEYNATIGYTQSDEISLILYSDNTKSQIPFNGRIQKLIGDMAAFASVFFNQNLADFLPEKCDLAPRFDCRVWNVPNVEEATNAIMWREFDCTKNSISMAAQSLFSHKELQGKHSGDMQDMMMLKKGVNWNDYPAFFKRGTYVQRIRTLRAFSSEEIEKLPEKHAARVDPNLKIERTEVKTVNTPPINNVWNRIPFMIFGSTPKIQESEDD